ncbi:MAG: HAD family hydrolase [Oscillospiraceae bacterium]
MHSEDYATFGIELITGKRPAQGQIKAALFDFDGTLSTLRYGWVEVMRPLMLEMIDGENGLANPLLQTEVDAYIDESTGIQTVYQMRWLAEQVAARRGAEAARDEWWYKDEYNRRLMREVGKRLDKLESGEHTAGRYLVAGSVEFLSALRERGVAIYVASGTDHADVVNEVAALGLDGYFNLVMGAPERKAACSKETVIRTILEEKGCDGSQLVLIGDGKVEISLGRKTAHLPWGWPATKSAARGLIKQRGSV